MSEKPKPKIDDGGPAFPSDYIPGTATTPGMSLRDYFAAKVMGALAPAFAEHYMSAPCRHYDEMTSLARRMSESDYSDGANGGESKESLAEYCYSVADAMLKARGGAA